MDKDQIAWKKFLEQLLKFTKEQNFILGQIEEKLHEMRKIAIYIAGNDLGDFEKNELNKEMDHLKREIEQLEKLYRIIVRQSKNLDISGHCGGDKIYC